MHPVSSIPCILMRGGTSKGPFFKASDLPADAARRDRVLLAALGSPDARQIDGIGGADSLTSKVAIVSPSERAGVDVDYLFAQVSVDQPIVDIAPSCGNMLSGVGPFALETGMLAATGDETRVVIFNVNTGSRIEAVVQTPGGTVTYAGDVAIDGVPGTAAEIRLNFLDIVGSKTGSLFPTGKTCEAIDGIPVTLIDVAVPMMIVRAADFGKTGTESPEDLDADAAFFARIEALRLEAGRRMGLGDVTGMVVPKVAMLAPAQAGNTVCARYFVPHKTHAAMAVTGGLCIASCCMIPGTIADGIATAPAGDKADIVVEHPSGVFEIALSRTGEGAATVISGGVVRTARKLMAGEVYVPSALITAP